VDGRVVFTQIGNDDWVDALMEKVAVGPLPIETDIETANVILRLRDKGMSGSTTGPMAIAEGTNPTKAAAIAKAAKVAKDDAKAKARASATKVRGKNKVGDEEGPAGLDGPAPAAKKARTDSQGAITPKALLAEKARVRQAFEAALAAVDAKLSEQIPALRARETRLQKQLKATQDDLAELERSLNSA
jgi:hypothetical protein